VHQASPSADGVRGTRGLESAAPERLELRFNDARGQR
jgi:hypothetical protein